MLGSAQSFRGSRSVRLINDKEAAPKYYKPEKNALGHFRFHDVFLRTTKKTYISFITPEVLTIVQLLDNDNNAIPSYNAIRRACEKRGIICDMRSCRKVFASWLINAIYLTL
jgi:hypothetical protein